MHTCMHPSLLSRSRSVSYMQAHKDTAVCSVMDAGHKDGQDEKVFHIRVCVCVCEIYWYKCAARVDSVCVSLSPCVSSWKGTAFALPRKHKTHPFGFVRVSCFMEQLASASPLVAAVQKNRLTPFPLHYSCFHLLVFPFVPQWGVSGGTRILDLSLWIVRTVGVFGEHLGHVGASRSPGLQQCPALPWVLEWPNGGLFACWHAGCSLSIVPEVMAVLWHEHK